VVDTLTRHYRAAADQDGFFWLDETTGKKCLPDEIANSALEALSDLLIAPLRFEADEIF
jgi:hypothetical protein